MNFSKSGTNTIHGSAFGFFQNSSLSKIDVFRGEQGLPKAVFHFGGSLGGPIIKDKLFVFGACEHKRESGKIMVELDPSAPSWPSSARPTTRTSSIIS